MEIFIEQCKENEAIPLIEKLLKDSHVYSLEDLRHSVNNRYHILKNKETGKVIGYGISNIYLPREVLKIDNGCLKGCKNITKKDFNKKIAFIEAVEILPEYRGNGFGKELVNAIKNSYPEYNIALLATQDSIDFWIKMGFENIVGWCFCYPYLFLKRAKN